MAEFRVLGIDHVQVSAPEDLEEETIRFYESVLGLERVAKPEGLRPGGALFRAGSQEIHLGRDEHMPPQRAHVALAVDDFDAIVDRLRSEGCHIEQAAFIAGLERCYTRDPAGNRIELTSRAPAKREDK